MVKIEVVYALPDRQPVVPLQLPAGSTIQQAIEQSGLLQQYPQIDLKQHSVGIFNEIKSLNQTLSNGDRVEIYRPLIANPKEARRAKAAAQRSNKKNDKSNKNHHRTWLFYSFIVIIIALQSYK